MYFIGISGNKKNTIYGIIVRKIYLFIYKIQKDLKGVDLYQTFLLCYPSIKSGTIKYLQISPFNKWTLVVVDSIHAQTKVSDHIIYLNATHRVLK